MANEYIKNIAREGRATRWAAGHLISDVYDKLATGKKRLAEAIAQLYLIDGAAARSLNVLADHCVYLCGVGKEGVLEHLRMQFDGADILTKPFTSVFKATADAAISAMEGKRGT